MQAGDFAEAIPTIKQLIAEGNWPGLNLILGDHHPSEVAEDLPGPGTVFLGVDWKFVKAVGVDETITGRVEIDTVRDDKPICTIKTSVFNAEGEACLTGTATTYTMPLAGL